MDIGIISVRYAKALYKYASEHKEEEKVFREMLTLTESFNAVHKLQSTLLNPILTDEKKYQLLIKACCGSNEISDSVQRFIKLIICKRRAQFMLFIAYSYISLYRKDKNIVNSVLTVPAEISTKFIAHLQKLIESKTNSKVEFQTKIDKEIGGGFILEYDTYRLDASMRTQIERIRRILKE